MPAPSRSQVTLLPAQLLRLAELARVGIGAVGISQFGTSVIEVNTGADIFKINAQGEDVNPNPDQEQLC